MQKKKKKSFPAGIIDFFMKSLMISSLCSAASAVYKKIETSITGAVLSCYEWISEKLMDSTIVKRILRDKRAKPEASVAMKISKIYDASILSRVIHGLKWAFLSCQLNVLAVFGLMFGFSSALVLILDNFAFSIRQISLSGIVSLINPLMTSVAFIVVSILVIFSKKPLIRAINESLFFSFIFFDFFDMRRVPASDYTQHTGLNAGVATLLGILLGGMAIWVPPSTVAVCLVVLIAFLVILHSPEAGAIGTIFILPFSSTLSLVFLVLSTAFSFFVKCCRRKRIMKPEGLDLLVIVFAAFTLSGGAVSVDIGSSLPKALVYLSFLSIYFVVKNIIRTETLALSCLRSLGFSSMIVAFIGIVQYLLGNISQIWQDTAMFAYIPGRTVSTFENPNVLGEYLVLVLPVLFATLLSVKKFNLRVLFFVSYVLCFSCLVFTWSRGAWLGFLFSIIIFVLLKSPAFLSCTVLASPAIALALSFLVNSDIAGRFMSIGNIADSSTAYRLNIWRGAHSLIADKGLYGIGIGTEAFSSVFPQYALAGTESAPHTHSLYLQLITETGIFSLIVFALICLAYFSLVMAYLRTSPTKNSRTLSVGFFCGIFAFLIQSLTDHTWYNYKIYLFFWLMLSIAMAVLNLSKENDRNKYLYG